MEKLLKNNVGILMTEILEEEKTGMNLQVIITYKKKEFRFGLSLDEKAIILKSAETTKALETYFDTCLKQIGAILELPGYFIYLKLGEKNDRIANDRRADDYYKDFKDKEENKGKIIWECSPAKKFETLLELSKLGAISFNDAFYYVTPVQIEINEKNIIMCVNPYRDSSYVKKYDRSP